MWLIGAVVCLLAANRGLKCSLTQAMDGRTVRCGIISSCQSAATSEIVKRFWSRTHVRSGCNKYRDLYIYFFTLSFAKGPKDLVCWDVICVSGYERRMKPRADRSDVGLHRWRRNLLDGGRPHVMPALGVDIFSASVLSRSLFCFFHHIYPRINS